LYKDTYAPYGEISVQDFIGGIVVGLLAAASLVAAMVFTRKPSAPKVLDELDCRLRSLEERVRLLKAETPYSSTGTFLGRKSG
jgi:hypothetical protein